LAYAYETDAFQPTEWLTVRCRIFYSRMAVDRLGGFSFLTDDGPVSQVCSFQIPYQLRFYALAQLDWHAHEKWHTSFSSPLVLVSEGYCLSCTFWDICTRLTGWLAPRALETPRSSLFLNTGLHTLDSGSGAVFVTNHKRHISIRQAGELQQTQFHLITLRSPISPSCI